jgi:hypothetical protein
MIFPVLIVSYRFRTSDKVQIIGYQKSAFCRAGQ